MARHDRDGKIRNHDGNRKSIIEVTETQNLVDLINVDDEGSTHEQPSELPDGTFGSDGVSVSLNSGSSTRRVSNETKTMDSSMTTKKSSP